MTVAALSTAGFSQYIAASSNLSQSQQVFQLLGSSIATGNLSAAQAAFNTYQQLTQSVVPAAAASSSTSSGATQLAQAMKALGSAIGSGNVATAQSAFATVQDVQQSTPTQQMTNAENAAAQTVQWVDDLLNLSTNNLTPSTPVDPTTAILNSAYGQASTSDTTSPITSLLSSAYGAASSPVSSVPAATTSTSPASAAPSRGNNGSGASVNAYA